MRFLKLPGVWPLAACASLVLGIQPALAAKVQDTGIYFSRDANCQTTTTDTEDDGARPLYACQTLREVEDGRPNRRLPVFDLKSRAWAKAGEQDEQWLLPPIDRFAKSWAACGFRITNEPPGKGTAVQVLPATPPEPDSKLRPGYHLHVGAGPAGARIRNWFLFRWLRLDSYGLQHAALDCRNNNGWHYPTYLRVNGEDLRDDPTP